MASSGATLEWFGATTYRLKVSGLTIFLDTWLNRPSNLPVHLRLEDVTECHYIIISHAHFDHLPGADVIAKQTGAKIIANGEAIRCMRDAGVPEAQLIPIGGGEQIPLNDKGAIVRPYPALHCLMTFKHDHSDVPEIMDTGKVYTGNRDACTLDITKLMTNGFGWMRNGPEDALHGDKDLIAMHHYLKDPANVYSFYDGGQMMYSFSFPGVGNLLFSSHAGGWEGVIRSVEPKPDVAILGIVGRANLNGVAFQGSLAEFIVRKIEWLHEPRKVIWTLHDEAPLKPYSADTSPATKLVEERTRSRVATLGYAKPYDLFA